MEEIKHIEADITHEMCYRLQAQKEEVIKERFAKIGLSRLLENADKKRFKGVMVEIRDGLERWYADDGTDDGLLVITFMTVRQHISPLDEKIRITAEIKYY